MKRRRSKIRKSLGALMLSGVMLLSSLPMALTSTAQTTSNDQQEFLHETEPGVLVEKAYTQCIKDANGNCTGSHSYYDGSDDPPTNQMGSRELMDAWNVKDNYTDGYFAVMYKMIMSTATRGISGDNGCCGIVIGGENFATAYLPHDESVNRKFSGLLSFGSHWASGNAFGKNSYTDLSPYLSSGDGEIMIVVVGSYLPEKLYAETPGGELKIHENTNHMILRLRAYVNGNPVKIWGEDYEAYYDNTLYGGFNGNIGYVTRLHNTPAYARFISSRTQLDSTAFNEIKSKVDASRPSDIQNMRRYWGTEANVGAWGVGYAQPKQWKVFLKHFAVSYTFKADDNTTGTSRGDAFGYGSVHPECGLSFGSGGRDSGGAILTARWGGYNQENLDGGRRFLGYVTAGPWWDGSGCQAGSDWVYTENGGAYVSKGEVHTILVTGTYDAANNKAYVTCYVDGVEAKVFGTTSNAKSTATINNFDGYIGWMTHVKDVQAVARFQQWDEDGLPMGADALNYRSRGPVLGYWKREITQNGLSWGINPEDTYDRVDITAAYDHYDHPDANIYQLGEIADSSRSFYMTVTMKYDGSQQGFYVGAEKPVDNRKLSNGEIQVGNSTVGNDPTLLSGNVREWYSKYYAFIIDGNGNLCIWDNQGDYGFNAGGDNYINTIGLGLNWGDEVRIKLVYSKKTVKIYADKVANLNRYQDPKTERYTLTLAHDYGTTFGLWAKNAINRNNSPYYSTDVKFSNVKVSYGLQTPTEVNALKEVLESAEGTSGSVEDRNKHLCGFVQTRTTVDGTYDLRIMIEGDEYGFRRDENYDAFIIVKFTDKEAGNSVTMTGFNHHIAYTEFSFYDAEYYFHTVDGCGMLALVINNIPLSYTNIEVYLQFCQPHAGLEPTQADLVGDPILIGTTSYQNITSVSYYGGTPAPNSKPGYQGEWENKR